MFAIRQLIREPGFTVVAVLMLALGIGANTAMFSVIHGVVLRPLPFPEHERLVTLWESAPAQGIDQQQVSPPTFADWQAQSGSFEEMAFWTGPTDFNFVTQDGIEKVRAAYPSASLFRALRVEPQLGRGFLPEEDLPRGPLVAVISHRLWQERFSGEAQVLGRALTVDTYGRRTYTVVGVMPPGFQFPEDTDLWLAAGWNGLPRDRRSGHWLHAMARLKPGISLAQAKVEMNTIQSRLQQEHAGLRLGSEVSAVPLLRQTVGRNMRAALFVLWGAVAGVLLIACANVANLMLARAVSRQKEIAVRLALGAGRWRIMRQLLAESLLLALLGGAGGMLIGYGGIKLVLALSPGNIPRLGDVGLNGTALLFTFAVSMLTGVIFGLAPAWQCAHGELNDVLKEGTRGATSGVAAGRTRQFLVVAEVGLATLLLIGAGLTLQSFARLMSTERGFQADRVIAAELDFSVAGFTTWVRPGVTRPQVGLRELLERVRQLPGVHSAGASSTFLRRNNEPPVQTFNILGRAAATEREKPIADHSAFSPGYLPALGVRLLRGRDFTEADTLEAPGAVIVNESFVRRFFPNEEPLGHHVTLESTLGPMGTTNVYGQSIWSEIVGVISDIKSLSAQPEAVPAVYRPYWQWPMQSPTLFVRVAGDPRAVVGAVRREIKSALPQLPAPKIRLLRERVGESMAQPRFQASLINLFGGVALLLAACGIYGVLAYSVNQRETELCIRMALGAQRSQVLHLILGHGMRLTLLGVGCGIVAALALSRVLSSLLYQVAPTDLMTFVVVGAVLSATALAACWLPARRATRFHLRF